MRVKKGIVKVHAFAAVLGTAVLCANLSRGATQESVKIIVNPEVGISRLSQAELARIYLGKKTFWESGSRIAPSLLKETSPITESFLEASIRKTVRQYRAYWKRRLFSGKGTAPKTFASSRQVANYVAENPGAIGVVDAAFSDDRVHVVELTN